MMNDITTAALSQSEEVVVALLMNGYIEATVVIAGYTPLHLAI
jgi:hypothetical protein